MNIKLTKYLEDKLLDIIFILALIIIFPFRGNFIAFHSLAELISIVVAAGIFMVVWNSKNFVENKYYLFIGTTFVFIAVLDGLHTFSYENVGVLLISSPNMSMQFWVAARYLQSASFLIAPFLIGRKINITKIVVIYFILLAAIVLSIMTFKIFPDCYMDQYGSTLFRRISEVVTSLLFFLSFYVHYQKRNNFDKKLFRYLTASIGFMIAVEAFFIFDIQTYNITRILVPYLKAISFYILYKALVEHNLEKPYSLLFKELKESEEKYRLIVDNTSDLVFLIDLEGNFLFINKGIERHTGYTESEIVGKNINGFLSPKSYNEAMNRIQLRLRGAKELPKYEVEIISKNKQVIIFELNTSPIYIDEKIASILIVARDISERKRNEEKIKSLNETIRILNKILRHDILNDLTLLLNIVDAQKEGDEKMKKNVFSTINKSVNLIERMGELEQAVTFGEGIKQCKIIDFVDFVVRNHPEIEFKVKGDCTVMADDAIISVIDNIVRNAITHGKTKRIDIVLKDQKDYCEIKIADYGIGIPDHIKDRIFEEGFSYGEGRSSGLGLFIVKKVIERYGGEIRVEDNKPSGAVFILKLKRGG